MVNKQKEEIEKDEVEDVPKTDKNYYLIVLFFIVASILLVIILLSSVNETLDEEIMKCIANNSILIVKEGCSACGKQEKELGDYLDNFKIIDITENPEVLKEYEFDSVPTWVINNKTYSKFKSLEELKVLTGC